MQIEKSILLPTPTMRGTVVVTLAAMEVGDSILVAGDPNSVRNSASSYGRRSGKTFTIRKQPDGQHRCWRVS